jgi:hypothetical protein
VAISAIGLSKVIIVSVVKTYVLGHIIHNRVRGADERKAPFWIAGEQSNAEQEKKAY